MRKSVSKRMLSAPTASMSAGRLFFSNQNVAKRFRLKYSEGSIDIFSSCLGAFSDIS